MRTNDWDTYFRRLTGVVATRSHCIKRQVGCVIVKDKRIIATGYNGLPSKFPNCNEHGCVYPNRKSGESLHKIPCTHAEQNALLQCAKHGTSCDGAVAYVSITPCNTCLTQLIQAGIHTVFVEEFYYLGEDEENQRVWLLEQAKKSHGFQLILLPVIGVEK